MDCLPFPCRATRHAHAPKGHEESQADKVPLWRNRATPPTATFEPKGERPCSWVTNSCDLKDCAAHRQSVLRTPRGGWRSAYKVQTPPPPPHRREVEGDRPRSRSAGADELLPDQGKVHCSDVSFVRWRTTRRLSHDLSVGEREGHVSKRFGVIARPSPWSPCCALPYLPLSLLHRPYLSRWDQ